MGNITIQGDLTGGVPGGEVGGASNLTTVGAIPYVSASGVLNQDPTALFWDSANDRLGVGTASPLVLAHIKSGSSGIVNPPNVPDIPSRLIVENSVNASISILSPTANAGILNFGSPADGRAAGVGRVAGSSALYFYVGDMTERARFATSGNFLIGTTTDDTTNKLQVVGTYQAAFLSASGSNNNYTKIDSAAGARVYQTNGSGTVVNLIQSSSSASYFNAGNLLIGGTTDGNYKLDIQKSGSSGTLRVYDQTATTGSTRARVRGGAADGTGDVIFTVVESSDNVNNNSVQISPNAVQVTTGAAFSYWNSGALLFPSGSSIAFTSSATSAFGTKDISLSRASAGVLQVGDGGANANGYLSAARIGVGTASPAQLLDVTSSGSTTINLETTTLNNSAIVLRRNGSTIGYMGNLSGVVGVFTGAGSAGVGVFNSTGNVAIGGTTDGNYKLDVANSGSSGTLRVYDQTATTGSTLAVIQAGAGQSGNLTEWRNNAGTAQTIIDSGYKLRNSSSTVNGIALGTGNIISGTNVKIGWSDSTDTDPFVAAIGRFGTGKLEINSGTFIGTTPGNARDLLLRRNYVVETTSDPSASDLTIAGSNAEDVSAIYMKNDKLVIAYNRSGTVTYLTIPLDGATTSWTQSTTAP